ncbi:MAG TPA: hypothetical protein VFB39_04455 [Solirubrobacteraceae bacterium]|nr:hypothetical protein [Solirubrobacteraceae bacterium]
MERERFSELETVLDAIESRVQMLTDAAPNRGVDLRYKTLEPVQQVFARLELAGPERFMSSIHAGIDVRGDGSAEPYLGSLRRRSIDQRSGESAAAALRRVLLESD